MDVFWLLVFTVACGFSLSMELLLSVSNDHENLDSLVNVSDCRSARQPRCKS